MEPAFEFRCFDVHVVFPNSKRIRECTELLLGLESMILDQTCVALRSSKGLFEQLEACLIQLNECVALALFFKREGTSRGSWFQYYGLATWLGELCVSPLSQLHQTFTHNQVRLRRKSERLREERWQNRLHNFHDILNRDLWRGMWSLYYDILNSDL